MKNYKTANIHRLYDHVHRKSKRILFSKVAKYKINIQKSIMDQYILIFKNFTKDTAAADCEKMF